MIEPSKFTKSGGFFHICRRFESVHRFFRRAGGAESLLELPA
jgi:hypothetical protein